MLYAIPCNAMNESTPVSSGTDDSSKANQELVTASPSELDDMINGKPISQLKVSELKSELESRGLKKTQE